MTRLDSFPLLQVTYTCYLSSPRTGSMRTQFSNFTIDRLIPLTFCSIDVYAENMCNSVTYSGPMVSVYGQSSDGAPSPVQSLSVVPVSDRSLFVTWEPPVNYTRPGLNYSVNVTGLITTVFNQTYLFVDANLSPGTTYTVAVRAISRGGMSAESFAMNTTKPSLPSPPQNVRFLAVDNSGLTLEWAAESDVDRYRAFWKCNEMNGTIETTDTRVMILSSDYLGTNYTWCTARVQSVNEVGYSDLSMADSSVIPQSVPPSPTCYLIDNQGSSAVFSFTVTDPFSLDLLSVEWQLNTSSAITEDSGVELFTGSTLTVLVQRNTEYVFRLRLCNSQGCGDYCPSIDFTTNTVSLCFKLPWHVAAEEKSQALYIS